MHPLQVSIAQKIKKCQRELKSREQNKSNYNMKMEY